MCRPGTGKKSSRTVGGILVDGRKYSPSGSLRRTGTELNIRTLSLSLQELLAPQCVEFFSSEWQRIGDKASLEQRIHEATAIPIAAIRGAPLEEFGVQERLAWASQRESTRREDNAYCLQGIFSVFLPLIYGEEDHAWVRLRRAIEERWPSMSSLCPRNSPAYDTAKAKMFGPLACRVFRHNRAIPMELHCVHILLMAPPYNCHLRWNSIMASFGSWASTHYQRPKIRMRMMIVCWSALSIVLLCDLF